MTRALVGRDAELQVADRYLDAVPDGAGALVLEGEPGIGKTTVWAEAVRRAEARGYTVLSTKPAEAEAKLSYSGLADLLASVGDDVFTALPGPQRTALDIVLLRADGRSDRRAVFAGLASVVAALAAAAPVVLCVDDAQWLDIPSAAALEFAARRLVGPRVGVVISVRVTGGVRHDTFERALEEGGLTRVPLGPFTLAALHHVLKEELGRTLPRPLLLRIRESSGGNPLFALEMARQIVADGLPGPGEVLPAPPAFREVVRARVQRLPVATRDALLLAAVLAQPTLKAVDAAALAPAEDSGLVEVAADGTVAFAHPLYASAVSKLATAARRRAAHVQAAGYVDDVEQRARHLALGSEAPDGAVAAILTEAAAHARSRAARDSASQLEELALRFSDSGDAEALLQCRVRQGEDLVSMGEMSTAAALLAEAVQDGPTGDSRARAFGLLATARWWEGDKRGAVELAKRGLDDATTPSSRAAAHTVVCDLSSETDLGSAVDHGRQALALTSPDDPDCRGVILRVAYYGLLHGEGADPTAFAPGPSREWLDHFVPMWHDDFDAACAIWDESIERSRAVGDEALIALGYANLAQIDLWRGRWAPAAEAAARAVECAERTAATSALVHALYAAGLVAAYQGDVDRATIIAGTLLDAAGNGDPWYVACAHSVPGFVALSRGDVVEADRHYSSAAEALDSIGMREPARFRFHADHVEAVVGLGDVDRAERLTADLDRRAAVFPRAWTRAMAARCRGLVEAARGDTEAAVSALDDAVGHHEALDMPFERARTLFVRGEVHRRHRDKRLARQDVEQAMAGFAAVGAPLWVARAGRELARLTVRHAPVDLTATELEVATLAAEGRKNREIADVLFMSPKTVEKRLANVYQKLGIGSRAELGARMADRPGPEGT